MNEEGKREVLAIEAKLEESREIYRQLFAKLKDCGLTRLSLIVSDTYNGLVAASRGVIPESQLAAVQGALHAEHAGACAAQGAGTLCQPLNGIWLMSGKSVPATCRNCSARRSCGELGGGHLP